MKRLAIALLVVFAACTNEATRVTDEPTPAPRDDYVEEPVEWFLREISADEKTIKLVYTMSGVASKCQKEGGVRVTEGNGLVVLNAYKLVTTDRDRACTEELGYVEETATLKDPLGDRALSGCRPPKGSADENHTCRDLERSRNAGIFEFSPAPSG